MEELLRQQTAKTSNYLRKPLSKISQVVKFSSLMMLVKRIFSLFSHLLSLCLSKQSYSIKSYLKKSSSDVLSLKLAKTVLSQTGIVFCLV